MIMPGFLSPGRVPPGPGQSGAGWARPERRAQATVPGPRKHGSRTASFMEHCDSASVPGAGTEAAQSRPSGPNFHSQLEAAAGGRGPRTLTRPGVPVSTPE